jgi:hypothetical protein
MPELIITKKEQTYTVEYQFVYEIVVVFQSFWVDLSSSIYTMWYQKFSGIYLVLHVLENNITTLFVRCTYQE